METTIHVIVRDLPLEPVRCVHPGTSLAQAARALSDTRHGVLVVATEPVGEITEADVIEALAHGRPPETRLEAVVRGAPNFVLLDTPVSDAVAIMVATGRRAVVVVDEGRALGALGLQTAIAAVWGTTSWLGAFRVALHVEGS